MYIYIYICMYVFIYICIYIDMYLYVYSKQQLNAVKWCLKVYFAFRLSLSKHYNYQFKKTLLRKHFAKLWLIYCQFEILTKFES